MLPQRDLLLPRVRRGRAAPGRTPASPPDPLPPPGAADTPGRASVWAMTAHDAWVARDAAVVWHGFTQMAAFEGNQ
ncbi:MAG TPA: hypothetical protein VFO65_08620, partial [Acidimicrobiales bacterium]|nr:hypothetical protein [Acidimicrobiales bacterium]